MQMKMIFPCTLPSADIIKIFMFDRKDKNRLTNIARSRLKYKTQLMDINMIKTVLNRRQLKFGNKQRWNS